MPPQFHRQINVTELIYFKLLLEIQWNFKGPHALEGDM